MKRVFIYIILLVAVLLIPAQRMDIAGLRPVQTVSVTRSAEGICILTDTDDMGQGSDVRSALEDLKATSPGYIYLDTADYLLVQEAVQEEALELKEYMSKAVRVYRVVGQPDLKKVSEFLQIHAGGLKLKQWNEGTELPVLDGTQERMRLA